MSTNFNAVICATVTARQQVSHLTATGHATNKGGVYAVVMFSIYADVNGNDTLTELSTFTVTVPERAMRGKGKHEVEQATIERAARQIGHGRRHWHSWHTAINSDKYRAESDTLATFLDMEIENQDGKTPNTSAYVAMTEVEL